MTTSINHGYRGAVASIADSRLGWNTYRTGGRRTGYALFALAHRFEILKWAGAAYLYLAG